MDEYDETEEENNTLIVTIYSTLLMSAYADVSTAPVTRNPSIFDQRLDWVNFVDRHGARSCFDRHIRMKKSSFEKLLDYIRRDLEVDPTMAHLRGGVILPEVALYCTLRYIAGGSYSDVYFMAGISSASFYRILWKTIMAINSCEELSVNFPQTMEECNVAAEGFASVSDQRCIGNCVSVIDGYHLRIQTPSKKEAKNVKSFFLAITKPTVLTYKVRVTIYVGSPISLWPVLE
jgi:hypothetical protein